MQNGGSGGSIVLDLRHAEPAEFLLLTVLDNQFPNVSYTLDIKMVKVRYFQNCY